MLQNILWNDIEIDKTFHKLIDFQVTNIDHSTTPHRPLNSPKNHRSPLLSDNLEGGKSVVAVCCDNVDMNRPKSSSRLLSSRSSSRSVVTTVTTTLGQDGKVGDRRGRATSARRDEKLPSLAKINREIMDKSAELLGQRAMEPHTLVDWIKDKRG